MIHQVQALLDPLDRSPTECDGMTRLCHTLLAQQGIPHTVHFGVCRYQSQKIQPHYWIDLDEPLQGWRVDYRLRLWLKGETEVPNGVFQPERFPQVQYLGNPVGLELLPEGLFQVLLMDTTPWLLMLMEQAGQKAAKAETKVGKQEAENLFVDRN